MYVALMGYEIIPGETAAQLKERVKNQIDFLINNDFETSETLPTVRYYKQVTEEELERDE